MIIDPYRFASGTNDPHWSSVVLLLHCDGTDGSTTFTDQKGKTVTAVGNAQIDTAEKKYGSGSMQLDGNGDYASVSSSSAMDFGTSTDFTVEAWVYITGTNSPNFVTVANRTYYFGLYLGALVVGNGVENVFLLSPSFDGYRDKWTHVAHTRTGSTHRVFLDGVLKNTNTSSQAYGATTDIYIGQDPYFGAILSGWIDDVRVTKGVARYTSNFTPPDAAFPDS